MKLIVANVLLLSSFVLVAQNNVCFTVESNPNSSDAALSEFTKYIKVLDCFEIYAESGLSDAQVLHAAAIAAELLDNDEDGIIDDINIYNELLANQALMPLFASEGSAVEIAFGDNYNGTGVSAVLYSQEVDPSNPGIWGMDATVEEIMHTINAVGQVNAYPAAFALAPNSSLMTTAMDIARGGQFISIPNPYPSAAWYHYDDQTCDYECMAIEYMYWSTVSNMGLLDDSGICAGIANEWEPCTPILFQNTDVLMYNLITDIQYKIPQIAPDGNYCITTNVMALNKTVSELKVFPNPSTNSITVENNDSTSAVKIYNLFGELLIDTPVNIISINQFKPGVYFLKSGNESTRFQVVR